jgi:hypothetical protein
LINFYAQIWSPTHPLKNNKFKFISVLDNI